jgi:hypothetical protein
MAEERVSDIDTAMADSPKLPEVKRSIREADIIHIICAGHRLR